MSAEATIVLVDGSNVVRSAAWVAAFGRAGGGAGDAQRELVDVLASWAAVQDVDVLLVFDGTAAAVHAASALGTRVQVLASGARSGDSVLERAAAEHPGRLLWLVTSDVALAQAIPATTRSTSDEFVQRHLALRGADGTRPAEEPPPTGIAGLLDDDVAARLERMRRSGR